MNSCKRALHNAERQIEELMTKPRLIVTGREAFPSMVAANKICVDIWGHNECELEGSPKSYKQFHVDIYGNEMSIP